MSWSLPKDSGILAVHGAVLPTGTQGQLLLFGGDEHWSAQAEPDGDFRKTRIYDIATDTIISASIPSPDSDVFCAGQAFTADGRLLIVGGTSKWPDDHDGHVHGLDFLGHKRCWLYNPRQQTWTEARQMNNEPGRDEGGGRWYPGAVTLGNGDVMTFFGHLTQEDFRHRNTTPERYNVFGNNWTLFPQMCEPLEPEDGNRFLMYPRVFQLPDGYLFFATGMPVDYTSAGDGTYFSTRYDPNSGNYIGHKITEPSGYGNGWSFPCVLLPLLPENGYAPKVLFCGRNVAKVIDLSGPPDTATSWNNTANNPPLGVIRDNSCAVILPTGKVAVIGGVSSGVSDDTNVGNDTVHAPEIYDPVANTWSVDAGDVPQVPRNYHSIALLLPNGNVFSTAGNNDSNSGNPATVGNRNYEIYTPTYPAGTRPTISSAPKSISYGQSFRIETTNAADIQRVAIIRCGSCTHAYDFDQRYVGLNFTHNAGDNFLTATAPGNGNIAPPGYYTLWIIDNSGRPCQLAKFVRMTNQGCYILTDRNNFSSVEIDAMLPMAGGATFSNAFYAVFDGFLPDELGVPTPNPAVTFHPDSVSGASTGSIVVDGTPVLEYEATLGPDIPRRFTWKFNLKFTNNSLFSFAGETRDVFIKVTKGSNTCTARLTLIKQANPFMLDGATSWLSTDLRVFQVPEGGSAPGVGSVAQGASPHTFITNLLNYYNDPSRRNNPGNPFHSITQDQNDSRLEISRMVDGRRIYNYAVAKVHFISSTLNAENVRVFFRMFNTAGTAMNYNKDTTYRRTAGASPISLLGFQSGEISNIPFFATQRVNTSATSMEMQTDAPNVQTLTENDGNEFIAYFGCWLDINQTDLHFPISNQGDGPFGGGVTRRSIQQLIRGVHQCLVAEVHFDPDGDGNGLIRANETPGGSDKLSQRNLAIVESDNPGGPETHTIQHTFEIKASRFVPMLAQAENQSDRAKLLSSSRFGPDELMIHWDSLPRTSQLTLYIPSITADEILELATLLRLSPHALEKVDEHTIRCLPGDISYVPIPAREGNIPGLLSIRLPDDVVKGQEFNVLVQQFEGRSRAIIGSFRMKIPVKVAADILALFTRQLSVLRHIALSIPANNRWYPIFTRYVAHTGEKVRGLGGNPDAVEPSPNGDGKTPADELMPPITAAGIDCFRLYWSLILAMALLFILPATTLANTTALVSVLTVVLVFLLMFIYILRERCRQCSCTILGALLAGSGLAGGILGVAVLTGSTGSRLLAMLAASGVVSAVLALTAIMRKCFCCNKTK